MRIREKALKNSCEFGFSCTQWKSKHRRRSPRRGARDGKHAVRSSVYGDDKVGEIDQRQDKARHANLHFPPGARTFLGRYMLISGYYVLWPTMPWYKLENPMLATRVQFIQRLSFLLSLPMFYFAKLSLLGFSATVRISVISCISRYRFRVTSPLFASVHREINKYTYLYRRCDPRIRYITLTTRRNSK